METWNENGEPAPLRLRYATPDELQSAFEAELRHGAVFVEAEAAPPVGAALDVHIDLSFAGEEIRLDGRVAALRPRGLSGASADPGFSAQLLCPLGELRQRLEAATGIALPPAPEPSERRASDRGPAHATATIEIGPSQFPAETVNLGYGGMLLLLNGLEPDLGTDVNVALVHPRTGEQTAIPGRLVSQALCDHGRVAVGVQFQYPADRIDAVMSLVDDLRSLHRAKELAEVSGSLSETTLEDLIEAISGVSIEGTLRVESDDDEGVLIYRDGQILHAATGLVTGMKALSRLLLWREGRFHYQATVEAFESTEAPLSVEAALLTAAVGRDEAVRGGGVSFDPEESFTCDEAIAEQLAPELDDVTGEVLEHVRMGFPVGAILDILVHGDSAIYKALAELIESGVVTAAKR